MLLIIEALLLAALGHFSIISATLGKDPKIAVKEQIFPFDMAPDSVDDQYDGCAEKMAQLVETKFLQKEMSDSPEFKTFWEGGEKNAKNPDPEDNLEKKHSVAIYVYTGKKIYRDFNEAVRSGKEKYKSMAYKWYSFQFLLTKAIQNLNKTQNKCYSTFRGTDIKMNMNVLNTEVRFGFFASSSHDRKVAMRFGTVSCFEIETCEGAELIKYSQFPQVQEVLIPPYEKFKVTAVKTRSDQKNLWCETVYALKSSGRSSDLNCAVAQLEKGNL